MSARKPHNDWAGYVCELRNQLTGDHNVIIDIRKGGEWAACEDEGGRYVVICNAHSTLIQDTSLPRARLSMKWSPNFCEQCQELAKQQEVGA